MITPTEASRPNNFRERRRIEWHRVILPSLNHIDIMDWCGSNLSYCWSSKISVFDIADQIVYRYYFEDEKDAMLFILRWA